MNTRVFIVNFRGTCFVQNDQALSGYVNPYNFNSNFKYFCSMKRLERLNNRYLEVKTCFARTLGQISNL